MEEAALGWEGRNGRLIGEREGRVGEEKIKVG